MSFHVGQRVVCVRDTWCFDGRDIQVPVLGQTYTIRSIISAEPQLPASIRLNEIINPAMDWGDLVCECSFTVCTDKMGLPNFRPVVERKTNISIFTRLLLPEHQFNPNELID